MHNNGCRCISCCVEVEDISVPFYIAYSILQGLLRNIGLQGNLLNNQEFLDLVGNANGKYLYLMDSVFGGKVCITVDFISLLFIFFNRIFFQCNWC